MKPRLRRILRTGDNQQHIIHINFRHGGEYIRRHLWQRWECIWQDIRDRRFHLEGRFQLANHKYMMFGQRLVLSWVDKFGNQFHKLMILEYRCTCLFAISGSIHIEVRSHFLLFYNPPCRHRFYFGTKFRCLCMEIGRLQPGR